jgi:hypothetical protein
MLATAVLPLRLSSSVSKETFWPSTSLLMPARSSAAILGLDEAETLLLVVEFHCALSHRGRPFADSQCI